MESQFQTNLCIPYMRETSENITTRAHLLPIIQYVFISTEGKIKYHRTGETI